MKTLRIALFLGACLVQLAVPAWMIARHERVLAQGAALRFRTAPVDPVDFFRGRYVALAFVEESVPEPAHEGRLRPGRRLYVVVEEDADGFARLAEARLDRPSAGNYLRVRARYVADGRVHVELPFDRYYMTEELAPEAERAYRDRAVAEGEDAFVTVRVRGGYAVLEELYLGGVPVREYLDRRPAGE